MGHGLYTLTDADLEGKMSAAGEIFEILTLTYTDFKGKNGHRRRDTILRPLLPKTVFLPSASRITIFLP